MEGMMRQMVMAGPRKSKIIEVPIHSIGLSI